MNKCYSNVEDISKYSAGRRSAPAAAAAEVVELAEATLRLNETADKTAQRADVAVTSIHRHLMLMYVVLFVAIAALYLPAGWQAPAYEYAKETMDSVVESATAFIASFAKAEPEVPPDLVRVGFHL